MKFILANYALFLMKGVTVVILIAIVLKIISGAKSGKRKRSEYEINWVFLNHRFKVMENNALSVMAEAGWGFVKALLKDKRKQEKNMQSQRKKDEAEKTKGFVLSFVGGGMKNEVEAFSQEVNALLLMASPKDRVLVKIESPGGSVSDYGLLAQQILRLRNKELEITVCADIVAASGGYLAACCAHKIVASPFAIIGSIGVISIIPNINKLLKRLDIDVIELTAGEHKRPLSPVGKVTEEGVKHTEGQLKLIHEQFRSFVKKYRDHIDLDIVGTGDYWTGEYAMKYGLVDELGVSDDIIFKWVKEMDVFEIEAKKSQSVTEKIKDNWSGLANWVWKKMQAI